MSIRSSDIVLGALVTEKSERLRSGQNSYTFRVARRATKVDIRRAIETLFRVHVTEIRVMNFGGKVRRMGMFVGPRPDWKKAIVCLKPGEKIQELER